LITVAAQPLAGGRRRARPPPDGLLALRRRLLDHLEGPESGGGSRGLGPFPLRAAPVPPLQRAFEPRLERLLVTPPCVDEVGVGALDRAQELEPLEPVRVLDG